MNRTFSMHYAAMIVTCAGLLGACSPKGTFGGNPNVDAPVELRRGTALSSLTVCATKVRLIDRSGNTVSASLPESDVAVSADGVSLATIRIPAGTYSRVELDLNSSCPSLKSLQMVNSHGQQSATLPTTLTFNGAIEVDSGLRQVVLDMSALAVQWDQAQSESEILSAAQSTPGNLQSVNVTLRTIQAGQSGTATNANAVLLDQATGDFYVAGSTTGVMVGSQVGTHGNIDALVSRFTSAGLHTWSVQLGASGSIVTAPAIARSVGGDIYIVGSTSAALGGSQYGSLGTHDAYVAKLSSSGALLWISQIGSAGTSTEGESIAVDSSGAVIIAGVSPADFTGAPIHATLQGDPTTSYKIFIAKFDSSGVLQWMSQTSAGGTNAFSEDRIALDSSGNIFLAGAVTGTTVGGSLNGVQYGPHGTTDTVVAKYDSGGSLQWISQFGAAGTFKRAMPGQIALGASGDIFVAGSTGASDSLGGTQYGDGPGLADLYLAKFNSSGARAWVSQLGKYSDTTHGTALAIDSSNNVIVAGDTSGSFSFLGGTQAGAHGSGDALIANFDSAGNLLKVDQLGVAGTSTAANGVCIDPSRNQIFVGGSTGGFLGGNEFGSLGTSDLFVSRMGESF